MARVSGYNFHCNDVKGKFGTPQTATGIPISDTHYTLAVPTDTSRTPYRKGDVLLVKNNENNTSALYLVTDVGGLPHADIDIVEGVGLKALGIEVTKRGKTGGVSGVSQKDGFDTQKVGAFDYKYGDAEAARPLQELLVEINKGEKDLSALTEIDGFKATIAEEDLSQKLTSLAPNIKPDVLNGGAKDHNYPDYDPTRRRRTEDDMTGHISQLMQEGNMVMALFMMMAFILMGEDAGPLMEAFFGNNTGPGRAGGGPGNVGSYDYNKKGHIGGVSPNYEGLKLPDAEKGEKAGDYFARAAQSFVGQREVGKNGGAFVNWLMEPAGLAGQEEPWCAGFVSKIYEGTGLFNYTAGSLDVMRQGATTSSFVYGMKGVDNIEIGDAMIFDRKRVGDAYGHIGVAVKVHKDDAGNVVGVTTVEGNSGDKVTEKYHSLADLRGGSRYMGHVDVSHRADALNLDIDKALQQHYHPEKVATVETDAKFVVNVGHNARFRSSSGGLKHDTGADNKQGTDEVSMAQEIAASTKASLQTKGYAADNVLALDLGKPMFGMSQNQANEMLTRHGQDPAGMSVADKSRGILKAAGMSPEILGRTEFNSDGTVIFTHKGGARDSGNITMGGQSVARKNAPFGENWARGKISEAFVGQAEGALIRLDFDARGGRAGKETIYTLDGSKDFADLVQDTMTVDGDGSSKGVWKAEYQTLKWQDSIPAAIVELGDGEHSGDSAKIESSQWRQRQGELLANTFDAYAAQKGVSPAQVNAAKAAAEAKAAEAKAAEEAAKKAAESGDEDSDSSGGDQASAESGESEGASLDEDSKTRAIQAMAKTNEPNYAVSLPPAPEGYIGPHGTNEGDETEEDVADDVKQAAELAKEGADSEAVVEATKVPKVASSADAPELSQGPVLSLG